MAKFKVYRRLFLDQLCGKAEELTTSRRRKFPVCTPSHWPYKYNRMAENDAVLLLGKRPAAMD